MIVFSASIGDYASARYKIIRNLEEPGGVPHLTVYQDKKTAAGGFATIGAGFLVKANAKEILQAILGDSYSDAIRDEIVKAVTDEARDDKNKIFSTDAAAQKAINDALQKATGDTSKKMEFADSNAVEQAFNLIIERYEKGVDAWLPGVPPSRERLALLSMHYNAVLAESSSLKAAIAAGDRAEAWFQIRYVSNGGTDEGIKPGIAKRRFYESTLFGLYVDAAAPTFNEVSSAYRLIMAPEKRSAILAYEAKYGRAPDSEISKAALSGVVTAYSPILSYAGISEAPSLEWILKPARNELVKRLNERFSTEEEKAPKLKADDWNAAAVYFKGFGDVPDEASENFKLDATQDDARTGNKFNSNLMVGGSGNDTLLGGKGRDYLIGLDGSDSLNGGEDNDTLVGGLGNDILLGGKGKNALYGGKGSDEYRLVGNDSIKDSDGHGSVYFDTTKLSGGNGDPDTFTWQSADGQFTYFKAEAASVKGTLHVSGAGYSSVIQDWKNGELGITLTERRRGSGPSGSPFDEPANTRSPLVLDLDGNGIHNLPVDQNVYFDHDGNGLAELSGWAGPGDGLLVRDRNGNGQIDNGGELFGNHTVLSSGALATNGFAALSDLDDNHDGRVDAVDAAFAQLRIWQDANSNAQVDAGELQTLWAQGVSALGAAYSSSAYIDAAGNAHAQTGSFTRTSGGTGAMTDVWFGVDLQNATERQPLPETVEVSVLPDLAASGHMRSLHQAMLRDTSGRLQGLVTQYVQTSARDVREGLLLELIYVWAGVENIDPASRPAKMIYGNAIGDARKLATLEALYGEQYFGTWCWGERDPNPHGPAARILLNMFDQFMASANAQLMAQTHLKPWFDLIGMGWDEASGQGVFDVTDLAAQLELAYVSNPESTFDRLLEFVETLEATPGMGPMVLAALRVTGGGVLGELLTSIGLYQGDATNNFLTGDRSANSLSGEAGDDVLHGNDGNDTLDGGDGVDSLSGGEGRDSLYGGAGGDTLSGGVGDDYLVGGVGADTYRFAPGGGQDVILNADDMPGGAMQDALRLEGGIAPAAVQLRRNGHDLIVLISGGRDRITVLGFFDDAGAISNSLGRIEFDDGTVWSGAEIRDMVVTGSNDSDAIMGSDDGENIAAKAGDDYVLGFGGNDTLDGGMGNDTLRGGVGVDTYLFGKGDGRDVIDVNTDPDAGASNVLRFKAGVTPGDVTARRQDGELVLDIAGSSDQIRILGFFHANDPGSALNPIQEVVFSDGTHWNTPALTAMALKGTDGDDSRVGTVLADTIDGMGGHDGLSGGGGADVLVGGAGMDDLYGDEGNDYLKGGADNDLIIGGTGDDTLEAGSGSDGLSGGVGSDTYVVRAGDGRDRITTVTGPAGDIDTLRFAADVAQSSVFFRRDSGSLVIEYGGRADWVTLESYFSHQGPIASAFKMGSVAFDATGLVLNDTGMVGSGTGGAGNDIMSAFDSGSSLSGAGGHDLLFGGRAGDVLTGGDGNDTLYGDGGVDVLSGGAGDDVYYVNNSLVGDGGSAVNVYLDFALDFDDVVSEEVGAGVDTLVTDTIHAILPENIENLRVALNRTFSWWTSGDDRPTSHYYAGNALGNVLDTSGFVGRITAAFLDGDVALHTITLNGGEGVDTLIGGMANEVYVVDNVADVIIETGVTAGGAQLSSDGVISSVSWTLSSNLENLTLTGGLVGYGNALDNILKSAAAYSGVSGYQTIYGGFGNDTYFVGISDVAVETVDAGFDRLIITDAMGQAFDLSEFENIEALAAGGDVTGTAKGDWVSGYSGRENSRIDGAAGNDIVQDSFNGVPTYWDTPSTNYGVDTLLGGAGDDTIRSFFGRDEITGGAGNDLIEASSYANNSLFMTEADGFDTFSGERATLQINLQNADLASACYLAAEGSDVVFYIGAVAGMRFTDFASTEGGWTVLSKPLEVRYGGATLTSENIQSILNGSRIFVGGSLNDNVTGYEPLEGLAASGGDYLFTGGGNDTVDGLGGSDTIDGGAGNDSLQGGAGNDSLVGAGGVDTLLGGGGNDTISDGFGSSPDSYYLPDDAIGADVFIGGGGDDVLVSKGGRDRFEFSGDFGHDTVELPFGATAVDLIFSGAATDTWKIAVAGDEDGPRSVTVSNLSNGSSMTTGYLSEDSLLSFVGATTTTFSFGDYLRNILSQSSPGDDSIYGDAGADAWFAGPGNDWINGLGGADTLDGGAGDDTLFGREGADSLTGGDDNDSLYGGSGKDSLLGGNGADHLEAGFDSDVDFLSGDAGDDFLFGGNGDTLNGGVGDDIYQVSMGNGGMPTIVELANEGIDSMIIYDSTYDGSSSVIKTILTPDNVENVSLLNSRNAVVGNSANNMLSVSGDYGGTADGGAGNDTLSARNQYGGSGDDLLAEGSNLVGGQGSDTYVAYKAIPGWGPAGGSIYNYAPDGAAAIDTLYFGDTPPVSDPIKREVVLPEDVAVSRSDDHLVLTVGYDQWYVRDFFKGGLDGGYGIDLVRFANGTVWSYDELVAKAAVGAAVADLTLSGAASADVMNGAAGADSISGGGGNDTLIGGDGNDYLDGELGQDSLVGGAGNDTYRIDDVADVMLEDADAGSDTVLSSITISLTENLENLTLTGIAAINGTGNASFNRIMGNDANNVLDGGASNDQMTGWGGNDTYLVDNASDEAIEYAGDGVDQVLSGVTFTLGSNVENMTLTGTASINGTGNDQNNILTGNSAANILDGRGGADSLTGGVGDDVYIVDSLGDVVTESSGEGADTVQATVSGYVLGANVEKLVLLGSGDISGTGNALANTVTGNGGHNTLDGGAGTDTLIGGLGDDTYLVDATADVVTEKSGQGSDKVVSTATYTLGGNVEILALVGSAVINGTGNTLDNVITGNAAVNTLTGGAGNDTLSGELGNDSLVGGTGSDIYLFAAGDGSDTISESDATLGNLDELRISGVAANNVSALRSGSDLLIKLNATNETITIKSWFTADANKIERVNVNEGEAVWDVAAIQSMTAIVNHAPVAVADTKAATENVSVTATAAMGVLTNDTDVDAGDTKTVSSVSFGGTTGAVGTALAGAYGTLTLNADGSYSYLANKAAAEALAVGQSANEVFSYTAKDAAGATSSSTLTFTISGANDAPVAVADSKAATEDVSATATAATGVLANDTDVDTGNTKTVSAVSFGSTTGTVGAALAGAYGTLTLNADGSYSYLANRVAAEALAVGQSANEVFNYTIKDAAGAASSSTLTFTISGANDAPVLAAAISNQSGKEGAAFSFALPAGTFSDVDASEILTYSAKLSGGSALPAWLSFNATTGVFSGTPSTGSAGTVAVVVTAADKAGAVATGSFSIAIGSGASVINGTTAADALTGTSGNDQINGLAGNDTINGGSGNDSIDGGSGNDSMTGGAGDDLFVVDSASDVVVESSGGGADSVQASVTYTLASNVENLTLLGTGALSGTGNTLNNVLIGNSAANTLSGGSGADTLVGAGGNDTYVVDNVGDAVTELAGGGTDLVQASVSYTLAVEVENLTLTGSAAINGTGNALNNQLTGNSGVNTLTGAAGNDTLNGGSGADSMVGGVGDDIYVVDNSGDKTIENANEGVDTVQSSLTWTLGVNIEQLTLTGTGAINGTGNALNNQLTGNSGVNTLSGAAGNDTLNGGGGADSLVGGAGDDVYVVDNSSDKTIENASEGADTVQASITWALGTNVENLTLTGTSAINATGNTLNNLLSGNANANTLTGSGGNDTLDGAGGSDSLIGGVGNDTYKLGRGYGADTVTENDGASGNMDIIQAASDIAASQLWFVKSGNNLEVSIIGSSDKAIIKDWYLGSAYHVEQFKSGDGKTLLDSQVDVLVSAMAAFAPPAAGQSTLPASYQTSLNGVIAANWT